MRRFSASLVGVSLLLLVSLSLSLPRPSQLWEERETPFPVPLSSLGTRLLSPLALSLSGTPVRTSSSLSPSLSLSLPTSFDARTHWPHLLGKIRQQGECGSCWAFSACEVLEDRLSITTKGKVKVEMSVQDLVSCDKGNYGCSGGTLPEAWKYLEKTGTVSEKCFPYYSAEGDVPACLGQCVKPSLSWTPHKVSQWFQLNDTLSMQQELYTNGPIQAGMTVYESFMKYRGGVYHRLKSDTTALGGHAIKIVGWGESNGTPYWIVANSWGNDFGMNGYFYIKRGTNDCDIESNVFAGDPVVPADV